MSADREGKAAVRATVAKRFERHDAEQRGQSGAAVLLRHREARQPHGTALVPEVTRKVLSPVAFRRAAASLHEGAVDDITAPTLLHGREREGDQVSTLNLSTSTLHFDLFGSA